MTHFSPFSGMSYGISVSTPAAEMPDGLDGAKVNLVGADYFGVAGNEIVEGRVFTSEDRAGAPKVAVVNESLARVLAAVVGPVLGHCLELSNFPPGCVRIVGVARDQRSTFLGEEVSPAMLLPREQHPDQISWGGPALLIRTSGEPGEIASEIRSALQSLSPDLPYVSVRPVEEQIRSELLPIRLGATLFTLFGVLALLLAGMGLFGVLAYFVGERTPEIGIRRALGASHPAVIRMVLGQALLPIGIGIAVGAGVAVAGARYLESLLYQVSGNDPAAYAAASAFLLTVALVAAVIPAHRASRVDPATALRHG
jgi:hypothetical protein